MRSGQWMDMTSNAINLQLVDFFPFLRPLYRVIPDKFSAFKRRLKEIQHIEEKLFFGLLDNAKVKIQEGKVCPSRSFSLVALH